MAFRKRNSKGRFSKRGKKERVYSHAKTILRRVEREEKARKIREQKTSAPPSTSPETTPEVFEFVVNFSYEDSGRSFDVIVTAREETEAYNVAIDFLKSDRDAQRIVRSKLRGWTPSIVKGNKTYVEAGNAEYRNESEA